MNRGVYSFAFKLKAVLCLGLTFNMCVWTLGCGQVGASLFVGEHTIAITPGSELAQHLKGSVFDGATAMEVSPSTSQFRLVFPDDRQLSGSYDANTGTPTISQLTFTHDAEAVTLDFEGLAITDVAVSNGSTWHRPAEWNTQAPSAPTAPSAPSAREKSEDMVTAYKQANSQLLDLAAELDAQGAAEQAASADGAKTGQTAIAWAAWTLAHIFFLPGGIYTTIVWIFQLIALIDTII